MCRMHGLSISHFPLFTLSTTTVFTLFRELQSEFKSNGVIKSKNKVCWEPSPEMVAALYPSPGYVLLLHLVCYGPDTVVVIV